MLKIRFSRIGRKHEPSYRLVLTEHTNAAKSGKAHEILGSYDSRRAEKAEIKSERVRYWLSKGAQPSDTVHNLLLKMGILSGSKRNVLSRRPKIGSPIETSEPEKIVQLAENKDSDIVEKSENAEESQV